MTAESKDTEARYIDPEARTVEGLRTLMAVKQWIAENPELPLRSLAFVVVWDGDPGTISSHVLASGSPGEIGFALERALRVGDAKARGAS